MFCIYSYYYFGNIVLRMDIEKEDKHNYEGGGWPVSKLLVRNKREDPS